MTKIEAINAMKNGAIITHEYFADDEWISTNQNGLIYTLEDGVKCDASEFWRWRSGDVWDNGYSLYLLPTDNLDIEVVDDLKEISKQYTNVLNEIPPYEYKYMKQGYDHLYPPVPKRLQGLEVKPVRNSKIDPKHGRNEPCSCGSGKKYKQCCIIYS